MREQAPHASVPRQRSGSGAARWWLSAAARGRGEAAAQRRRRSRGARWRMSNEEAVSAPGWRAAGAPPHTTWRSAAPAWPQDARRFVSPAPTHGEFSGGQARAQAGPTQSGLPFLGASLASCWLRPCSAAPTSAPTARSWRASRSSRKPTPPPPTSGHAPCLRVRCCAAAAAVQCRALRMQRRLSLACACAALARRADCVTARCRLQETRTRQEEASWISKNEDVQKRASARERCGPRRAASVLGGHLPSVRALPDLKRAPACACATFSPF